MLFILTGFEMKLPSFTITRTHIIFVISALMLFSVSFMAVWFLLKQDNIPQPRKKAVSRPAQESSAVNISPYYKLEGVTAEFCVGLPAAFLLVCSES